MPPYTLNIEKTMFRKIRKSISIAILIAFTITSVKSSVYAQSFEEGGMPHLPPPGVMVQLSPEFTPAHLLGITIHPDNALQFDFLIHKGDEELEGDQKKEEYKKLIKYFLASLTIPDEDQWVNLSPYEHDRIIKDDFGKTEMGRDLLAQDYMLKQITSSMIYPEEGLGRKFWDKIYERAWKEYHTTNIPVNTFNKVWIVPDEAIVYESGNSAYILKSHLKVMLEEDYLSLQKHTGITSTPGKTTHTIGSQVIREVILPELEKEVNEGKNFTHLRQMYSGMILATWYKKALKESLLGKIYADKAKVRGVDQDPRTNEAIYQRYLKAFKKGVFNYIKEDVDKYTNEAIPRKYFSGGYDPLKGMVDDPAMIGQDVVVRFTSRNIRSLPQGILPDIGNFAQVADKLEDTTVNLSVPGNAAMAVPKEKMESPPPMAGDQWGFFSNERHSAPIVGKMIDLLVSNERFEGFPAAERPFFIRDRIQHVFIDLIEELEGKPGSYAVYGTGVRKNDLTENRDLDLTKSDQKQVEIFFDIVKGRIENHSERREEMVLRGIMSDPKRSLGYLADYDRPDFEYLYEKLLRWQRLHTGQGMDILAQELREPELETEDVLVREIANMVAHKGKFIFTPEQKAALIEYVAVFDKTAKSKISRLSKMEMFYELQDVLGDDYQEAEALFSSFNEKNPDLSLSEKYTDGTPMPANITNRIKNIFMKHAVIKPAMAHKNVYIIPPVVRKNAEALIGRKFLGYGTTEEIALGNARKALMEQMEAIGLKDTPYENIFDVKVEAVPKRQRGKEVEIILTGSKLPSKAMVTARSWKIIGSLGLISLMTWPQAGRLWGFQNIQNPLKKVTTIFKHENPYGDRTLSEREVNALIAKYKDRLSAGASLSYEDGRLVYRLREFPPNGELRLHIGQPGKFSTRIFEVIGVALYENELKEKDLYVARLSKENEGNPVEFVKINGEGVSLVKKLPDGIIWGRAINAKSKMMSAVDIASIIDPMELPRGVAKSKPQYEEYSAGNIMGLGVDIIHGDLYVDDWYQIGRNYKERLYRNHVLDHRLVISEDIHNYQIPEDIDEGDVVGKISKAMIAGEIIDPKVYLISYGKHGEEPVKTRSSGSYYQLNLYHYPSTNDYTIGFIFTPNVDSRTELEVAVGTRNKVVAEGVFENGGLMAIEIAHFSPPSGKVGDINEVRHAIIRILGNVKKELGFESMSADNSAMVSVPVGVQLLMDRGKRAVQALDHKKPREEIKGLIERFIQNEHPLHVEDLANKLAGSLEGYFEDNDYFKVPLGLKDEARIDGNELQVLGVSVVNISGKKLKMMKENLPALFNALKSRINKWYGPEGEELEHATFNAIEAVRKLDEEENIAVSDIAGKFEGIIEKGPRLNTIDLAIALEEYFRKTYQVVLRLPFEAGVIGVDRHEVRILRIPIVETSSKLTLVKENLPALVKKLRGRIQDRFGLDRAMSSLNIDSIRGSLRDLILENADLAPLVSSDLLGEFKRLPVDGESRFCAFLDIGLSTYIDRLKLKAPVDRSTIRKLNNMLVRLRLIRRDLKRMQESRLKLFSSHSRRVQNVIRFRPAEQSGDNAQAAGVKIPGGIDFNSAHLDLQIKRDGQGVPLPLVRQDMAQLNLIQGFEPEIIEIKAAVNVPIISELQRELHVL